MAGMERFLSILLVASTAVSRKVVILDDNEWDSVVVTTSPVKITNSRFNQKNSTKGHAFRFNNHSDNARMMKECEEGDLKCNYDNQLSENSQRNPQDTIEKFLEKFSSVTNVKINNELRNSSSKAYWNQIDSEKHNHPFDDQKGWVTLDPIPWSTSKVSKWKPNQSGDRPWMVGPPQQQVSSSQLWVTNGHPPESNRPSSSWGLAPNEIITDNKPNGFPLDAYPSAPQPDYLPPAAMNPALPHGYQPPSGPQYQPHHHQPPQPSIQPQYQPINHFRPPNSPTTNQPPYHWQQSAFNSYSPTTNQPPYQWQHSSANNYPPPQSPYQGNPHNTYPTTTGHPPNYPEVGNGQWVLLSTTKGYSVPQRYHDRKMQVQQSLATLSSKPDIVSRSLKSKYEENDIGKFEVLPRAIHGNRKSDDSADMGQPVWNVDGINILHTKSDRIQKSVWKEDSEKIGDRESEPQKEISFKRTVRLTVLPALNNTSTFSHDGMLEVDSSPQTVEEAQQEEVRMKKLQQLAVVNTGRRTLHMVPIVQRGRANDFSKKKAAMIAAVGAGMIPASMAVILPVALGRRRRSLSDETKSFSEAFFR